MQKKNLHGGPVIVIVAIYKHFRVFKYIISTYTYQLIQKKHVEKKELLT